MLDWELPWFHSSASCLWRRTKSIYSTLPSRLSFERVTLRARWNFRPPLRALSSSSRFFWMRGSTSTRKPQGLAPYRCPLGTSICQPLKNFPITHGVCLKTSFSVFTSFLSKESRMSSCYSFTDLKDFWWGVGSNSSSRAFLFLSFALRDGGERRYFPGCKGFNKRALAESGMGSSRMFCTSWRVGLSRYSSANSCFMYSSIVPYWVGIP